MFLFAFLVPGVCTPRWVCRVYMGSSVCGVCVPAHVVMHAQGLCAYVRARAFACWVWATPWMLPYVWACWSVIWRGRWGSRERSCAPTEAVKSMVCVLRS
jgi:hypothetical protein